MACLFLVGCKRTHRSTGSYVLIALAVVGVALAVRILLYSLTRWLQRRQQRADVHGSNVQEEEEEDAQVEMQGVGGQPVVYRDAQRYCRRMPPLLHSRRR